MINSLKYLHYYYDSIMENNRSVIDVIKLVAQIIPENETELIVELSKYVKSLFNKAPELLIGAECWIPFINILNQYIPDMKEVWHIQIDELLKHNKTDINND